MKWSESPLSPFYQQTKIINMPASSPKTHTTTNTEKRHTDKKKGTKYYKCYRRAYHGGTKRKALNWQKGFSQMVSLRKSMLELNLKRYTENNNKDT